VGLLERARYARELPDQATTAEQVQADVASVVSALWAGAGRRQRQRATWLPASLVRRLPSRRRRGSAATVIGPSVDRTVRTRA
jgi:hypothetical protein